MKGLVIVDIVIRHGCSICMLFTLTIVYVNANREATHPLKSPLYEEVETQRCMLLGNREAFA